MSYACCSTTSHSMCLTIMSSSRDCVYSSSDMKVVLFSIHGGDWFVGQKLTRGFEIFRIRR